jgi:hypothetical protein
LVLLLLRLQIKLGLFCSILKAIGFLMDYLEAFRNFVFRPSPGTPQHREWRQRSLKAVNDERAKPVEARDPARLRRLRAWDLELRIEHFEVRNSAAVFRGSVFGSALCQLFSQAPVACRQLCAQCH